MDAFEVSSFPAALPGTLTFVEERPPAKQLSTPAATFYGAPSEQLGIREMARQQWESLKPLIQRVYIEENKSFPYLANILRDEHGFEPTKRQFSRKIEEWGFKKNVSRSERRKILQTMLRSMDDPVPDLQDRRLKSGKLKNWQRRYRGEAGERPFLLPQQSDSKAVNEGFQKLISCLKTPEFQVLEPEQIRSAFPDYQAQEKPTEEPGPSQSGVLLAETRQQNAWRLSSSKETSQDSWPFDWSTVDVPGSPGLARLFGALKIECATPVPPLFLDTSDSDDAPTLSSLEIQEVFNKDHEKVTQELNHLSGSKVSKKFVSLDTSFSTRNPHYPWRNINEVFCGYSSSPLNEVYVFPQSRNIKRNAVKSKDTECDSLQEEQAELEYKLRKLKKQFKISHPAVVKVMESLADVYYELDRDKEAELISRQLVDIYRQTLGSNNYKTLQACVSVINCIIGQGDYLKAQAMCQDLRSTIFGFVQPDDLLAIDIASTEAWLATDLLDDDTAERLHRELLQIHLTSSGPKHVDSIYAMRGLGIVITRRSLKEGEILLQTAVHLSLENPIRDARSCAAMDDLAYTLCVGKGYDGESLRIATLVVEKFTPSLGTEHPEILRVRGQRAWIMAHMGKLLESEKLFRVVISAYSREGRSTRYALDAWRGLAYVLSKMGQKNEAIAWNKKIIESQLSHLGASHPDMRDDCNHLGDIYEEHGHYDEALKLYHEMIDKIRESGEDPNGAITEFETRISDVKEQMEQSTSPPSTEDYSSDWESGSDGGESDEEPEDKSDGEPKAMDEEASEQTGQEEESELETMDWMAFVHEDFLTG